MEMNRHTAVEVLFSEFEPNNPESNDRQRNGIDGKRHVTDKFASQSQEFTRCYADST